jgi:Flp pilus assembly protein TadG
MPEHVIGPRMRRSRGQALAEFALTIPIFLLVLLALIEGAWYAYTINSLDRAVQEGGRYAALPAAPVGTGTALRTEVQNKVRDSALGLTVNPSVVTVSVYETSTAVWCSTDACFTGREPGDKVRVSFTYTHTPLTAMVFGGSATFPQSFATEYVVE